MIPINVYNRIISAWWRGELGHFPLGFSEKKSPLSKILLSKLKIYYFILSIINYYIYKETFPHRQISAGAYGLWI